MKKHIVFAAIALMPLFAAAQRGEGGRSPAGEKSGPERGGSGNRGGSDGGKKAEAGNKGRATYEADRSRATPSEADRNRGMNDGKAGSTNPGTRDAGTMSARDKGTQQERDRELGKTPKGREQLNSEKGKRGREQ